MLGSYLIYCTHVLVYIFDAKFHAAACDMFLTFYRSKSCKLYYFMQSVIIKSNGITDVGKNFFQNTSKEQCLLLHAFMQNLEILHTRRHCNFSYIVCLFTDIQEYQFCLNLP